MHTGDWLTELTGSAWPIIGMVHLKALPGSPGFDGDLTRVVELAAADAEALREGGVDAIMVENFGDAPFYPESVPNLTIACMTRAILAVRERAQLPLGVNVLRNDGGAALAIAAAVEADFVRVNVLTGAMVTDQGLIQGKAHLLARERHALARELRDIPIMADVDVKHAAPLAPQPLGQTVADTVHRGGADAVLVSGSGTGAAPSVEVLEGARANLPEGTPLLLGSGLSIETAARLVPLSSGAVVGTCLKRNGQVGEPVDPARVEALVRSVRAVQRKES